MSEVMKRGRPGVLDPRATLKPNAWRPRQVMDNGVLVGTIEREGTGGVTAVLEATGEQRWFPRSGAAEYWIRGARAEMVESDAHEHALSFRHQWDYVS